MVFPTGPGRSTFSLSPSLNCPLSWETSLAFAPLWRTKRPPERARARSAEQMPVGRTDGDGGLVGQAGAGGRASGERKPGKWLWTVESSGAMQRGFLKEASRKKTDEAVQSRKRTLSILSERHFRQFSRARARGKSRSSVSRCPRSLAPSLPHSEVSLSSAFPPSLSRSFRGPRQGRGEKADKNTKGGKKEGRKRERQ